MEAKEIFESLGLPADIADVKAFREAFDSQFIGRALAHQDPEVISAATGKVTGSISTHAKRLFALEKSDIEGKKVEEILDLGIKRFNDKIAQLEEATKNTDPDKYKKQLEGLTKERDDFKTLSEELKGKLESAQVEAETKIKSFKIGDVYKTTLAKIPLVDNLPDVARTGFNAEFQSKYQLELDEKENVIVKGKDGNMVPNQNGTGFLGLEEVLKKEAAEQKILKVSNGQGKSPVTANGNNSDKPEPVKGRQLPKRAASHVEYLTSSLPQA